jgi:small subunit ribosomal protein S17
MKILEGKVVSNKMSKTIVVEVERQNFHPLYKKIIRRTKRYKVESENPNIKIGDIVKIKQARPISKEKHFIIV